MSFQKKTSTKSPDLTILTIYRHLQPEPHNISAFLAQKFFYFFTIFFAFQLLHIGRLWKTCYLSPISLLFSPPSQLTPHNSPAATCRSRLPHASSDSPHLLINTSFQRGDKRLPPTPSFPKSPNGAKHVSPWRQPWDNLSNKPSLTDRYRDKRQ